MVLRRKPVPATETSLVKTQVPILDVYRAPGNSEIQLANHENRLAPLEIYDLIKERNLSPTEQQKFTALFIARADHYIERPGVITSIFGIATLVGVGITVYNLWKNGLVGAIGPGGLTAMIGVVFSHFEQQGKIDRRQKMIAFAETLSFKDSLDPDAKTALVRFIRNSRSANLANY